MNITTRARRRMAIAQPVIANYQSTRGERARVSDYTRQGGQAAWKKITAIAATGVSDYEPASPLAEYRY